MATYIEFIDQNLYTVIDNNIELDEIMTAIKRNGNDIVAICHEFNADASIGFQLNNYANKIFISNGFIEIYNDNILVYECELSDL